MMKLSQLLLLSLLMIPISMGEARGQPLYASPGWGMDYPELVGRVGEVLGAIDSPAMRSQLAAQWIDFSKRIIAKSVEQRGKWLDLQAEQLQSQQQAAQLNVEAAKLQLQIEQLRANNLKLERENLELRQQLQAHAAPPPPQSQRQPQAQPESQS
jgi:ribosomal protein L12E/L44/L45/RPP1/RPP2